MGKKSYLDLLHDIEVGDNKSLLTDFVEIPKKSATKRELADEIMQSISTPSEKTSYNSYEVSSDDFSTVESEYIDDEDDDDADEDSSNFIANFINDKTKKKKKKKNNDLSYDKITSQKSQSAKDIPQIKISYSDVSGRIIIDDEVAPVSVNVVNIMDFEDVCPFDFDSDTIIDFLADVYKFIIASKYPSVIMTKEEFEVNLGILEKIDLNQFMFFLIDDYILGYYVDPNSSKNFYKIFKDFQMDKDQIYSFISNLTAYLMDETNIFPYNDNDEFDIVVKHRMKNMGNFVDLIYDTPGTKYAGHNYTGENIYDVLKVLDYSVFIDYIRETVFPQLCDNEETDDDDSPVSNGNDDDIRSYISNLMDDSSEEGFDDEDEDEPIVTKKEPARIPIPPRTEPKNEVVPEKPQIKTPEETAVKSGVIKKATDSLVVPIIRGNKK